MRAIPLIACASFQARDRRISSISLRLISIYSLKSSGSARSNKAERCSEGGLGLGSGFRGPDMSTTSSSLVDRGVVYVVTGEPRFYRQCKQSISSLRSQGYKGPVLVLAERPRRLVPLVAGTGAEVRDVRERRRSAFSLSRRLKSDLYRHSPFVHTLYLDVDTKILRPIDGIWGHLRRSPVALCRDVDRTLAEVLRHNVLNGGYSLEEALYTRRLCGLSTSQLNSGVMLFRRGPQSQRLFDAWGREWERFQGRDQLALMRALALTGVTVSVLEPRYNAFVAKSAGRTVICHRWTPRPRKRSFAGSVIGSLRAMLRRTGIAGSLRAILSGALRSRLAKLLARAEVSGDALYQRVDRSELRDEILGRPVRGRTR